MFIRLQTCMFVGLVSPIQCFWFLKFRLEWFWDWLTNLRVAECTIRNAYSSRIPNVIVLHIWLYVIKLRRFFIWSLNCYMKSMKCKYSNCFRKYKYKYMYMFTLKIEIIITGMTGPMKSQWHRLRFGWSVPFGFGENDVL